MSKLPVILLVDDDGDYRALVGDALSAAGIACELHEAADGREALDFLHRRGRHADAPRPNLIYLDLEMPEVSGQQVLQNVKADPQLRDIPIVMMTGVTDDEHIAQAIRSGANSYIVKPTDPQMFVRFITRATNYWLCVHQDRPAGATQGTGTETNSQSPRQFMEPKRARGPRILIVEDDPDQRELICETMRIYFDYPDPAWVVAVATGGECLAQDLGQFEIIMLDYNLPDMQGIKLLDRIVQTVRIPVIFVTGENDSAIAAEAIRRGAQDYVIKLGDYLFALPIVVEKNIRQFKIKQENAGLQDKLAASLEEIRVKNLQLEESLHKLESMAATDPLTGLANRRAFAEMLEHCYKEALRYDFDLTCAMCDLDHYKKLNDTLGHLVGDRVLVTAAEVITSSLRSSDSAARYGGDEFVILLPHTSVEKALAVGNRIRQELSMAAVRFAKIDTGVTMSIGIASLKADRPPSADALVAMADNALYIAKEHGKNRIITCQEIAAVSPPAEP